jgi:hypothetical protein
MEGWTACSSMLPISAVSSRCGRKRSSSPLPSSAAVPKKSRIFRPHEKISAASKTVHQMALPALSMSICLSDGEAGELFTTRDPSSSKILRMRALRLLLLRCGDVESNPGIQRAPQTRQSAKAFSQVVGIGTPPTPHPQASVPPPFGFGGRVTLAGERGVGRVPIPTRGHTLWYSLYICTLWREHFLPADSHCSN